MQIAKIHEEVQPPEQIEFHEYLASEEEGQEAELPLGEQQSVFRERTYNFAVKSVKLGKLYEEPVHEPEELPLNNERIARLPLIEAEEEGQ